MQITPDKIVLFVVFALCWLIVSYIKRDLINKYKIWIGSLVIGLVIFGVYFYQPISNMGAVLGGGFFLGEFLYSYLNKKTKAQEYGQRKIEKDEKNDNENTSKVESVNVESKKEKNDLDEFLKELNNKG